MIAPKYQKNFIVSLIKKEVLLFWQKSLSPDIVNLEGAPAPWKMQTTLESNALLEN